MIQLQVGNEDSQTAKCQFIPALETPLPCDIVVDHDYAQNNFKSNLEDHLNSRGLSIFMLILVISHPI